MRLPAQIAFHAMDRSDALELATHKSIERLEHFSEHVMACRVTFESQENHHLSRQVNVRIDLTLPGRELVVNRVRNRDPYVALRDAFDDMKRQLEDAVRQQRGQQKNHQKPPGSEN